MHKLAPPPAFVMASGAILWAFAVLMPATHLGLLPTWSTTTQVLAGAPLLVLLLGAVLGTPALSLLGFITSLLPILLVVPELTGPRVYGASAFLALAAATVAHILIALMQPTDSDRRDSEDSSPRKPAPRDRAWLLTAHTGLFAAVFIVIAGALHFYRPVRELAARAYEGYAERALTALGLVWFVAWTLLVIRHLSGKLGQAVGQPHHLLSEWYRFEIQATNHSRIRSSLGWSLLIGAISAGALAFLVLFGK